MPDEAVEGLPSKDTFTTRLSAMSALVIAIGGIITTFVKPQDHSVTKASYAELAKAIEELNAQDKSDHDDIVALRTYVALKEGQPLFSAPMVTPSTDAGAPAHVTKAAAAKPMLSVHAPSASAAVVMLSHAPSPAAGGAVNLDEDLPPVHPEPAPVHPAAFDSVLRSAK